MSLLPFVEPECRKQDDATVEVEIQAHKRELGENFSVRRLLPSTARRMVGPFIFVDHMGPVRFDPESCPSNSLTTGISGGYPK
jgi:hypothetical protein